jgi:hypothetical protein
MRNLKEQVGLKLTLTDINGGTIGTTFIKWAAFETEQRIVKSCLSQRLPISGKLGDYPCEAVMYLEVESL